MTTEPEKTFDKLKLIGSQPPLVLKLLVQKLTRDMTIKKVQELIEEVQELIEEVKIIR